MSRHTPGPWWRDEDGFIASGSGDTYRTVADPHCMTPNPDNVYEMDANARLIAKAPELVKAIADLFEQCAMVHKHWGEGSNIKQANAAIERATALLAEIGG